jgi:hypothetical protein
VVPNSLETWPRPSCVDAIAHWRVASDRRPWYANIRHDESHGPNKVVDLLQRDLFKSLLVVFRVGASKFVVVADNLYINRIDTVSPANCIVKESGLPLERSGIRFANLTQLRLDNSKGIGDTVFLLDRKVQIYCKRWRTKATREHSNKKINMM